MKAAAELGDSNAQMLYANAHMSGVRPSSITAYPSAFFPNGTDISVAFHYYTKAAEQGRLEALFNVGILTLQGAGTPVASSTLSATPSVSRPSSSPNDRVVSSSPSAPLSRLRENVAARQTITERCPDAFSVLQKVAFTHPSVAILHEMSSRAFAKNDLTGALLSSIMLSELGHISGHVNAAALWPLVTTRRRYLTEELRKLLEVQSRESKGDSPEQEDITLRASERSEDRGKKEPEEEITVSIGRGRKRPEDGCKPISSFSLDREFLLPQADYLESPGKTVLLPPRKPSYLSVFQSESVFPEAVNSGGVETGGTNPGHSGRKVVSEERQNRDTSDDLCPAPSRPAIYLHHLRVSEFLRCWAHPHGEAGWVQALQEDFPFLKDSNFLEPSRVLSPLEQAEKEGRVCGFYFARRAAAEVSGAGDGAGDL